MSMSGQQSHPDTMLPHSRSSGAPQPEGGGASRCDSRILPFLKRIMATSDHDDDVASESTPEQVTSKFSSSRDRDASLASQDSQASRSNQSSQASQPGQVNQQPGQVNQGGPLSHSVQVGQVDEPRQTSRGLSRVTIQHPTTPYQSIDLQLGHTRSRPKAPVWEERQTIRSFSLQAFDDDPNREPFEGAYEAMRIMNPRHYQMPLGSRVVSIKCGTLQNIYKSLQHGVWACPNNVTKRLEQLFTNRTSDAKEKVIFLFSVSGSKQYCGFAEVQGYDPHMTTHFPGEDQPYQGSFILRWVYCKFVSFDEIRKVDLTHQGDSVTQMWNGMHYSNDLGRQVIQAYIEAPHFDNVLACHPVIQVDKSYRRRGNVNITSQAMQSVPHVAPGIAAGSMFPHAAYSVNANRPLQYATRTAMPLGMETSSTPGYLMSHLRRLHPAHDGTLPPPPTFGSLQGSSRPKVRTMQVVVNVDGSIRPATMSEAAIQLPAYEPQPLAFVAHPQNHMVGHPAQYAPLQNQYLHNAVYQLNSLPMAASAMPAQAVPTSRSLDLPHQAFQRSYSGVLRSTIGDDAHSWPENRVLPNMDMLPRDEGRTARYSTRYLQQIRSSARPNDDDAHRFRVARDAIEVETYRPPRRVLSSQRSMADSSMAVDSHLGWVDELVATPHPSPRCSR